MARSTQGSGKTPSYSSENTEAAGLSRRKFLGSAGKAAAAGALVGWLPAFRIGAAEADHDLSGLKGHRLRTHGALAETKVPFILNRPLSAAYAKRAAARALRSRELFDFAINGVDA